jgi:hypothetical protein
LLKSHLSAFPGNNPAKFLQHPDVSETGVSASFCRTLDNEGELFELCRRTGFAAYKFMRQQGASVR